MIPAVGTGLPSEAAALLPATAREGVAAKPFAQELQGAAATLAEGRHQALRSAARATGRPSEPDPWQSGSWPDAAGAPVPAVLDPAGTLRWGALQLQSELWAWVLGQSLVAGEGGLFGQGFSAAVYGDWFVRAMALLLAREGDGGLSDVLLEQLAGRPGGVASGPGDLRR